MVTQQKIDTTGYTNAAKRLVKEVEGWTIIPPRNGVEYRQQQHIYKVGEKEEATTYLSELQFNLAKLHSTHPDWPPHKLYICAGYSYGCLFNEGGNVKRIKAQLTSNYNQKMIPKVRAFANYLKYGAAEQLLIDATWVLHESVGLYEECRKGKHYTQAVRLLDNIAGHVDVNAKATNKVELVDTINYSALLSVANERVLGQLEEDVIEGVVELPALEQNKDSPPTEYTVEGESTNESS